MFTVIGILFTGIITGILLRKVELLKKTEKTIPVTVITMLFVLGLSVGSNKSLVTNIASYGWQAALLGLSSLIGSAVAAWIVYMIFFKKKGGRA